MSVDSVPAPLRDLLRQRLHAPVVDLGRPAAPLADDVVMVGRRIADDISGLAVRQREPFDHSDLEKQVEGAKHGGPADPRLFPTGSVQELGCREAASSLLEHRGYRSPRARQANAGFIERPKNVLCHAVTILSLKRRGQRSGRLRRREPIATVTGRRDWSSRQAETTYRLPFLVSEVTSDSQIQHPDNPSREAAGPTTGAARRPTNPRSEA